MSDEGSWLILYGPDLKNGIAGYGCSPEEGIDDFKLSWERYKDEQSIRKNM